MSGLEGMGKVLIILGVFLIVFGLLLVFGQKLPLIGRLPGDIAFQRGETSFYIPIVSSLIISLVLTIILNIVLRMFK